MLLIFMAKYYVLSNPISFTFQNYPERLVVFLNQTSKTIEKERESEREERERERKSEKERKRETKTVIEKDSDTESKRGRDILRERNMRFSICSLIENNL